MSKERLAMPKIDMGLQCRKYHVWAWDVLCIPHALGGMICDLELHQAQRVQAQKRQELLAHRRTQITPWGVLFRDTDKDKTVFAFGVPESLAYAGKLTGATAGWVGPDRAVIYWRGDDSSARACQFMDLAAWGGTCNIQLDHLRDIRAAGATWVQPEGDAI